LFVIVLAENSLLRTFGKRGKLLPAIQAVIVDNYTLNRLSFRRALCRSFWCSLSRLLGLFLTFFAVVVVVMLIVVVLEANHVNIALGIFDSFVARNFLD
jgi:hypothetical protein